MPFEQLTSDQIESLVGTRHASTGIEYPPIGLQPYYEWLVRTLHLLTESSCGALRVARDDGNDTTVRIAPGRLSISGAALAYPGGTQDLSAYNNNTALLWLEDDSGSAVLGVDASANGWPVDPHIKLAEVILAEGVITDILDRRFETIFRV
ncbi:MAG: hypothetical protein ACODAQ_04330 [Phycisphaeraceae bacterium]